LEKARGFVLDGSHGRNYGRAVPKKLEGQREFSQRRDKKAWKQKGSIIILHIGL